MRFGSGGGGSGWVENGGDMVEIRDVAFLVVPGRRECNTLYRGDPIVESSLRSADSGVTCCGPSSQEYALLKS